MVGGIDQILIEGAPKLSEVVFFHRASRSLLVSDLFFNVTEPETWATGLLLRMMGTYKRFGRSRACEAFDERIASVEGGASRGCSPGTSCGCFLAHGVPFEPAEPGAGRARPRPGSSA